MGRWAAALFSLREAEAEGGAAGCDWDAPMLGELSVKSRVKVRSGKEERREACCLIRLMVSM